MSDSEIRTFTPTEDITEPLKNGRGVAVVAHAGVAMPWARLIELGLVDKDGKPTVKGEIYDPADALDMRSGVDVPPGDLAADRAAPGTIEPPDTPGLKGLAARRKGTGDAD